jgi:integrase
MAKLVGRLNAKQCEHVGPGLHPDGDGLYLQVKGNGRSWIFRYYPAGKTSRDIGGGPFPLVGLAEARAWRDGMKKLRAQGIDPREHRLAEAKTREAEAARKVMFNAYADTYIATHKAAWRNAVHRQQWQSTIDAYVKPVFEGVAIADVDTVLVMKVLTLIWPAKPETASRVRGRIEVILDAAKTQGLRAGENPARWTGHLKFLLPSKKKVRKVRHHPALPYAQIPAFSAALRQRPGLSARALELCILTASRSGEIIGMDWCELDLGAGADYGLWTIPPERMKAEREHRVPLVGRALEILKSFAGERTGPVFPGIGRRAGQPMTEATLGKMLALVPGDWRDVRGERVTVHGMRSSFRDWAGERTAFPREVAEMALAHAIGDETEAAYFRADLFDKRRRLMLAWSKYCMRPAPANVTALSA